MFKRIFVTHHKTGHHLCGRIGSAVSSALGLVYQDLSTAACVPPDADVIVYESKPKVDVQVGPYRFESYGGDLRLDDCEFKGVHVVRHPFEVVASAYRWHRKIDRPWVLEEWQGTGKSYKDHLEGEDGISFEMLNVSRGVIMGMYQFPFDDPRFVTVQLECFEDDYDSTITRLARHLRIPEEAMLRSAAPFDLKRASQFPGYVTRNALDKKSHLALFESHHFELFRSVFPEDLFERLGYDRPVW